MTRTRRRVITVLAAALAAVLLALPLAPLTEAQAHPLGNFTVNRYARLDLYRDRVRLQYVVDYAEIPAFQLRESIDTDHDSRLSDAELDAFSARTQAELAGGVALSAGGRRLDLHVAGHRATAVPGQGGLDTLRLDLVFDAPVAAAGPLAISFVDGNFEGRVGWKEVVVRPSEGAEAEVSPDLLVDRSAALTSYPEDELRSAPDVRAVAFAWNAGTGAEAPPAVVGSPTVERGSGRLGSLLDREGSLLTFVLLFLAAALFGAQHALGPGHGKTVVAAYLAGSRGTARHAVALGLTVTATHTSTVYLLGFVTLAATEVVSPERVYLHLGVLSGLSIVGMGLVLAWSRLRQARRGGAGGETHRHGFFGKAHSHGPVQIDAPGHRHGHPDGGHEPGHGHPHGGREPEQAVRPVRARAALRDVISLGVIGGLLPCPSAIVVMLAAISRGEVVLGMLLIVAFSLGLAAVLTAIGLAIVLGSRFSGRTRGLAQLPLVARAVTAMPVVSAGVIAAVGLVITYQALQNPGL